MQDLKITLVQTNQFWEDKEANLLHFESHLDQIDQPTDLIVLPEMFHTGFTMNAKPLAEKMDGIGVSWLKKQAKKRDAALVASLIIEEEGMFYNRMVFVTPNGEINSYDKRKLFGLAKEDEHYSPGKKNTIVTYKGWKILLQVCYDLRFPENARNKVIEDNYDYDTIIYVANWPEKRNLHWKALLQARAIENQCYIIGLNRVGEDANHFSYSGDSCIISPLGDVEQYSSHEEILLNDMLEVDTLKETRQKLPFLKDRD
ncbi:MAG: amidohydrolase [Fluviicola sp.]|nr:MAG: amidohydrolase [Fluviicola sp.]